MTLGPIPFRFIRARTDLSWADVVWGFEAGWLDASGVVDHAVSRVAEGDGSSAVLDLASLSESELGNVPRLLSRLAVTALAEDSAPQTRWLYLALAWAYERRDALADPLGIVERLYADFGYPKEMQSLVRYMPSDGPQDRRVPSGSGEELLFRRWEELLIERGLVR